MAYCTYCGVELDSDMETCPLCGNASVLNIPDVRTLNKEAIRINNEKDKTENESLTQDEKRKLFWELSVIILFAGFCVTLLIDFMASHRITWSRYSASTCVVLIVHFSLFYFLKSRFYLFLTGSFLTMSLLILLFDSFTFHLGWGLQIGIPILLVVYASILAFALILRYAQEQGLNLIAYSFMIIGILCFGIESILDLYFIKKIQMGWSFFIIVTLGPMALVLLFLHYRYKPGKKLRRLFHI